MIAAGDRLRDLREDKGKTQAEISSLLGTTQQIYSRYETNRTDLPLRHLIKLADYYQVSADYILGRTSYPKNPPEMAKPFLKKCHLWRGQWAYLILPDFHEKAVDRIHQLPGLSGITP